MDDLFNVIREEVRQGNKKGDQPKVEEIDLDKLLRAVDSDSNDYLLNLTTKKIQELNTNILSELHMSKKETKEMIAKLQGYKYVDEIEELKCGRAIKWINITDPDDLFLTGGAILCDIKVMDDGISLVYKTFSHRHYCVKMGECLLFQKLSAQEQILLSALDHLAE
jgi:hypothetical protein